MWSRFFKVATTTAAIEAIALHYAHNRNEQLQRDASLARASNNGYMCGQIVRMRHEDAERDLRKKLEVSQAGLLVMAFSECSRKNPEQSKACVAGFLAGFHGETASTTMEECYHARPTPQTDELLRACIFSA